MRLIDNTNPCATNPCYNNALCINVQTQFVCVCPSGYGGLLCKGTVNTCQCQNNGVCSSYIYNSTIINECKCPSGYGYYILLFLDIFKIIIKNSKI